MERQMLGVEVKKIKTAGSLGIMGTMKSGWRHLAPRGRQTDKRGRSVLSGYLQVS